MVFYCQTEWNVAPFLQARNGSVCKLKNRFPEAECRVCEDYELLPLMPSTTGMTRSLVLGKVYAVGTFFLTCFTELPGKDTCPKWLLGWKCPARGIPDRRSPHDRHTSLSLIGGIVESFWSAKPPRSPHKPVFDWWNSPTISVTPLIYGSWGCNFHPPRGTTPLALDLGTRYTTWGLTYSVTKPL